MEAENLLRFPKDVLHSSGLLWIFEIEAVADAQNDSGLDQVELVAAVHA